MITQNFTQAVIITQNFLQAVMITQQFIQAYDIYITAGT